MGPLISENDYVGLIISARCVDPFYNLLKENKTAFFKLYGPEDR